MEGASAKRYTVTIVDTNETFECDSGVPVLKAMVALGRKGIPSGCHGGGCGVCKVRVMVGRFRAEAMSREHVSEAEEQQGTVLACRTCPLSDVRLKVLGKMRKAVTREHKQFGFV